MPVPAPAGGRRPRARHQRRDARSRRPGPSPLRTLAGRAPVRGAVVVALAADETDLPRDSRRCGWRGRSRAGGGPWPSSRASPARSPRRPARARPSERSSTLRHGLTRARNSASMRIALPIPAMIPWSSSASPISRPAPAARAAGAPRPRRVEARAQRVGAELRQRRVVAQPRLADVGAGACRRSARRSPRPEASAQPRLAVGQAPVGGDQPAAVHPQVAVQDEVAGEVREQVLAARLRQLERAALQLARRGGGAASAGSGPRQVDLAARRAQRSSAGRAVDRVALGHVSRGDELARLAAEAGGDDLLLEPGADHRLAVDALDARASGSASRARPRRAA